jgi:hypothetical protein
MNLKAIAAKVFIQIRIFRFGTENESNARELSRSQIGSQMRALFSSFPKITSKDPRKQRSQCEIN